MSGHIKEWGRSRRGAWRREGSVNSAAPSCSIGASDEGLTDVLVDHAQAVAWLGGPDSEIDAALAEAKG